MRYIVHKSIVSVIGPIWMPATTGAMTYTLNSSDRENCRDESGAITRDSVEQWLSTHSGDFRAITDFTASIEDGDNTITIPWQSEDSKLIYWDCLSPEGDDL